MSLQSAVTYTLGQCTYYVASVLNWIPAGLGNAGSWLANAQARGYSTSNTPSVGSVAVWGYGSPGTKGNFGHVAVVTGIQPNGLPTVAEMNATAGPGNVDIRNIDPWAGSGIIGYITGGSGAGVSSSNSNPNNNNGIQDPTIRALFTSLGITDASLNTQPVLFGGQTYAPGSVYLGKDPSGNQINFYDKTGKVIGNLFKGTSIPDIPGAIASFGASLGTNLQHIAILGGLILLGIVFVGGGLGVFTLQSGIAKKI